MAGGRDREPLLFQWRRAIMNDAQLTAADRHVALTLSTHMDTGGGGAYPTVRTLAAECARKADTVIASVQKLEAAGYLNVTRGEKRNRKGTWSSDANRYQAQYPHQGTVRALTAVPPRGSRQYPEEGTKVLKTSSGGAVNGAPPNIADTPGEAEATAAAADELRKAGLL